MAARRRPSRAGGPRSPPKLARTGTAAASTVASWRERVAGGSGEVVGSLSLATDVGMGAPLEIGLGTSLVATRLAETLGCSAGERRRAYWVALLRHIGCTAGSHEFAALVGNEIAFRGGLAREDFTD